MEFPAIGAHCDFTACQSLDFLPFQCSFCAKTFCTHHRLPSDHACTQWSLETHANSVQLCPRCDRLLLTPKKHNPATILKEHQDRACSLHLLPPVHSIAVQCARQNCRRRDRVVQTCPDCQQTFCLGHRHPTDHACPKIEERRLAAEVEQKKKLDIRDAVAKKFTGTTSTVTGAASASSKTDEEKQAAAKIKSEAARAVIEEAKAKVAARNAATKSSTSPANSITPGPKSSAAGTSAASTTTKPKKASRVVSLIKLKKIAKGEDKIPLSSRIYVYIRSPVFPQLDDKAVFIDKSWTVGRSMDKIVEWLKIAMPKNEPFVAEKRFSIFHAKENGDTPVILDMQERIQQLPQVESGDIFFLATADWTSVV
ncbi:AN1-type zinc finger protein 2A [Haplosporangium sp. Z 767]|nr:AN1-type zinc finger protein 2A [Haplosporangium sp. Z 767]